MVTEVKAEPCRLAATFLPDLAASITGKFSSVIAVEGGIFPRPMERKTKVNSNSVVGVGRREGGAGERVDDH